MAIIKCPECGHQISDKAPTCPNCGVEIAHHITRCPECGEVFFKDETICPSCHHVMGNRPVTPRTVDTPTPQKSEESKGNTPAPVSSPSPQEGKKKSRKTSWAALFISFIIALLVCGVCFYMYKNAQDNKEMQEYEFASKSNDPLVLQSYLDTYKDAPQNHIDAITAHLQTIKEEAQEWTNAWISNSKSMLEDYLRKHPETPHRAMALHKIDSIDWAQASSLNTAAAYQEYLNQHQDGDHYNEAEENMKSLRATEISDEERSQIAQTIRHFFVSINERDEIGLTSTVADDMTLLDKAHATKSDAIEMMHKMYKENVTNLVWRLNKDYNINKREIGDGQYEYTVNLSAQKEVHCIDPADNQNSQYRIKAKIDPMGQISELKLIKIVE